MKRFIELVSGGMCVQGGVWTQDTTMATPKEISVDADGVSYIKTEAFI